MTAYPESTYPAGGKARRSTYAAQIDVTMGCPTGELEFDQDYQVIRVTEDCAKITVSASDVVLLSEHVESLIIEEEADYNKILLRSAGSIVVSGSDNEVFWDEGGPRKTEIVGEYNKANPNPAPER